MFSFLSIINRLLALLIKWVDDRALAKAQKEHDALLENPADWFIGHFDSMPKPANKEADKTDTSNSKAK